MQCPYCSYEWTPRKISPKACPMCHRYLKPTTKLKPFAELTISRELYNYLEQKCSDLAATYPYNIELEEELSLILIKLEDEHRIEASVTQTQ